MIRTQTAKVNERWQMNAGEAIKIRRHYNDIIIAGDPDVYRHQLMNETLKPLALSYN